MILTLMEVLSDNNRASFTKDYPGKKTQKNKPRETNKQNKNLKTNLTYFFFLQASNFVPI